MVENFVTTILTIQGMTCPSCERRIERKLTCMPGVHAVNVSYLAGTVQITTEPNTTSIEALVAAIGELDYVVVSGGGPTPERPSIRERVLLTSGALLVLFIAFTYLSRLGIMNAFPTAEVGMGYGMLFVIGLLTSVHCVAMCGGINLSQSISSAHRPQGMWAMRPTLLYNMGRVISYTIVGGIVGALGSVVSFSGTAKGIVQLGAGLFMVVMGLNMLNLFPWLRSLTPRLPRFLTSRATAAAGSNSPLYVGLLNGLMPCGPLQAMQLYALSTGSPLKGAFSMLLFSLGTVPLMFGLGALSSAMSKRLTGKMMTASAALVVVLGMFMFTSGMALSGIGLPELSAPARPAAGSANVAVVADGVQTVTTRLSPGFYEPITVKAGIPVRWTIVAEKGTLNGCNDALIIPAYGIERGLHYGDNVIEFTPGEPGKIPYSCWMGMIRSSITIR